MILDNVTTVGMTKEKSFFLCLLIFSVGLGSYVIRKCILNVMPSLPKSDEKNMKRYIQINKFFSNCSLRALKARSVDEIANDCVVLSNQHNEDLSMIKSALYQVNHDVDAMDRKIRQHNVLYKNHSHLSSTHINSSINTDFSNLNSLLASYPSFPDSKNPSIEELQFFYHDKIEHHSKVLNQVKKCLPEVYATISQGRRDIENYSIANRRFFLK